MSEEMVSAFRLFAGERIELYYSELKMSEEMVSAFRLFAGERIYLSSSPDVQGQRNRIYF
jgi:hypothetical protein